MSRSRSAWALSLTRSKTALLPFRFFIIIGGTPPYRLRFLCPSHGFLSILDGAHTRGIQLKLKFRGGEVMTEWRRTAQMLIESIDIDWYAQFLGVIDDWWVSTVIGRRRSMSCVWMSHLPHFEIGERYFLPPPPPAARTNYFSSFFYPKPSKSHVCLPKHTCWHSKIRVVEF